MPQSPKRRQPKGDPVVAELDSIKRLLVLQLITSGIQGKDIASVLGVDQSVISRLVSARKLRKRRTS
jgi:predicted transcriptional regulator